MKRPKSFAAFRYFIVPSEQISFFDTVEEKREEAVDAFFRSIEEQKKLTYEIDERKHILVYNKRIANDIYICKFSRETNETIYRESATDIENIVEQNLPFVYIIIDIKKQIILIELKTSIFPSVNTTKNKLQSCLNISFLLKGFDVILEEITDEGSFWSFIESSQGVYEVTLKMNSPNLFGGRIDTNQMLKEVNQEYNNTHLTIKLFSEKAKLALLKSNIALINALKYISAGAGEWVLSTISQGAKKTYKSKHNIKKVSISNIELIEDEKFYVISKEIIDAIISVETVLIQKKEDANEEN